MEKERSIWIDTVKIYACILVVLGHFFQSMVSSEILPPTSAYGWFNQTIYYFHVPLFFICSGFLYQKTSSVRTFAQWHHSFFKKLISLGIPYIVFSSVTWLLKVAFADSVNIKADGLLQTLLLKPTAPYWYIYALVFIFLITFTLKHKYEPYILFTAALAMKIISFIDGNKIYAVKYVFENEIWFVIGMLLCFYDLPAVFKGLNTVWTLVSAFVFFGASIAIHYFDASNDIIAFAMGLLGCFSTLLTFMKVDAVNKFISFASKYTFPVFLMHTIFAAGLRSVLFKFGISNPILHITLGLTISFIGPVFAAIIMSKMKWLEFFLYPNKVIKTRRHTNV